MLNASARGIGWGVADQILSSLTNFLLGVLVARSVGVREFGAFGIAYAAYTLALGGCRALVLEPLLVRFSAASDQRSAVAFATGASVLIGIAGGALCVIVAAVTSDDGLSAAFLVLGIALPGLLLQDAWRFSFFTQGRGARAFWNDAAWTVVLFPAAAAVLAAGAGSIPALMGVWALGGWTGAALGFAQSGILPRVRGALAWIHQQRDLAYRFFTEFSVSTGATQAALFMIGVLGTLSDVGRIRAGQVILGPLNILFQGAGLVAVPETARLAASSPARVPGAVRALSALLTAPALAWAAAAALMPAWAGEAVMGENWAGGRALLTPLAIGVLGFALSYGPMTGLRALAAAHLSLRARIVDAASTLLLASVGAAVAGAPGAAWGFASAGVLRLANWWWHFRAAWRGTEGARNR